MVNKVIRFIWIDGEHQEYAQIDKVYQACILSALVFNPSYKVIIYTNNPLRWDELDSSLFHNEIIPQTYFDQIEELGITQLAHQSDYIRFNLLYQYGGIYADTDLMMIRSFDPLLNNKTTFAWETESLICSGCMVTIPGQELFRQILQEYQTNYVGSDYTYNSQKFLTERSLDNPNVTILPYETGFFYPNYRKDQISQMYEEYPIQSAGDIYKRYDCYAHHLWNSTTFGKPLIDYLNHDLELNQMDMHQTTDQSYISQLIAYIYREYEKILRTEGNQDKIPQLLYS